MGNSRGRCGLSVAATVLALLATWCLFAADAAAVTCTWNKSVAAVYELATNWSCGHIPTSVDDVVFSSAATGTCTVNPSVAHVLTWSMNAGAGTVNLGSSVTTTIDGAFTQSAGVFNAGTRNMSVGGAFTLSGTADFTSTSGRLEVGGAFTDSGGAFTHSSGQVMLNSTASQTFAAGDTAFYDLTINDGLVGYWKLDENTGTSIADSSGYGNTGTLVSGPSWVSGASLPTLKFNDIAGLSFDGTNDYATLGVNDFPALNGAKTVAFWAYWASKPSSSNDMVALMSGSPGVQIGFNGSSQLIKVWSGSTIYAASSTTATSGWHHIAYTYDGTTNILYMDGLSVGTSATAPTNAATTTAWLGTYNGSNEILAGRLDDVRIYNRALSATEINSLAIGRQPASYLAVQGMTGAPTIANDLVIASGLLSVGNNALTIGGNWWNYGGVFRAGSSEAVTFNGSTTGKYIRSGGHVFQDITFNGTGGWTLADDLEIERGKTLSTTAGTVDFSSRTFRGGLVDRTASTNIVSSTSTVVLDSTSNRTLDTTGFYNLRVEVPETNLVGYWKFDQGEGPLAWDYASTQHQGTLTNGPLWVNSGLPSTIEFVNQGAIDFDGTDDYVDVAAAVTPTNAAFTACAWGNMDVLSGDEVMVGIDGTTVAAWKLRRNGTDGKFSMRYYASDITGASSVAAGGSTSPVAGTWYHVCGVYSGSAVSLYVNGLLEGGPTTVSTPWSATNHTVIGAGKYNGAYIDPWNGKLDDVRIYSAALTATQIAALAAGRYANTGSSVTYTQGATVTVNGTFAVDSGTFSANTGSTYSTSLQGAAYINTGSYTLGGGSTIVVSGFTVRDAGVLNITASGRLKMASGTALVMDGTLNASNASANIQNTSVGGPPGSYYSFTVGSTATATPVLNITGLTVLNTDTNGMYINAVAGSATTFTRFDNIAFGTGTGNYLLRIYGTSLGLYGSGLTFDASTTYNARLTGNGTGDGETRAYLGATCTNTPCESYDVDDDSEPDGTGDTAVTGDEAVIQWMRGAYNDTAGTIQGFPTTAFDWNTFTYWNTYVAYRDYSGTTDRLFARDTDGAFKTTAGGTGYSYDFATGVGDIMGTPRWTTEGTGGSTVHYVYVLTSLGNVYKLIDSGTAFTLVTAQAWPYRNGASATATSSLAMDTSNVYWAGNDGTGAKKMFSLTTAKVLNGTRTVVADVVAALSVATVSSTAYLFTGTNGQIYRTPLDLASELTSAQATSTVYGRVTVTGGVVYFPEDIGKVWALSATTLATSWVYQDTVTTVGRHPGGCTANSQCTVRNLYVDPAGYRSYFGDKDGHVYVLSSAGALVTNYPYRPGASTDEFQSAPFYRSGVIIIGSTTGKVFIIDQNNGTGPAVYQTFNFQSAVSTVGYDSDGYYMVGTADGKLYYLNGITDPTPASI